MRKWLPAIVPLVLALTLWVCHKPDISGPTPPTPNPSPSATPTATAPPPISGTNGPLHIDNQRFRDRSNQKVYLLGAITCCGDAKSRGWPLVNPEVIDEISAARGNYTHIRVGPNSRTSPDSDHTGYARAGGKLDLAQWDESFFSRVRSRVEYARSRGVYVEVSLIDAWLFKHHFDAWEANANIQGFSSGGCDQFAYAPHEHAVRWVKKMVQAIGDLDNVLWLDGNEVFDCDQDATQWTLGLARAVQEEENRLGFPEHPFGTNAGRPSLHFQIGRQGYEVVHSPVALRPNGRPLVVNEYSHVGVEEFCHEVNQGAHLESSFMLWRGNMTNSQWKQSLACLREVKDRVGF